MVRHIGKMNRFFINPSGIQADAAWITRKEDVHHIKNVLRLKVGEKIEISDSLDFEYAGKISVLGTDCVKVMLTQGPRPFLREPATKITLYQGLPKQGKLEVIIQKSVELGVHAITPVFTARSVIADRGNWDKKGLRYQAVAAEAAAQCGRGIIPVVSPPVQFSALDGLLNQHELVLFFYEKEVEWNLKQALRQIKKTPGSLALIIGPEGGFSREEAQHLAGMGHQPVSLGRTILRTETAGPAALAMCMYELELKD